MEFIQRFSQQIWELENTDLENELVVLGIAYPPVKCIANSCKETNVLTQLFHKNTVWNSKFIHDVQSRLHFTYRTRFSPIPKDPNGPSPLNFSTLFRDNPLNTLENALSNPDCFNTDIGWGCMIRTGQSLLANALQIVHLSRDFRVVDSEIDDPNPRELEIIDWFIDDPKCAFSLHNFVRKGQELSGKKPGEWFGPSATSRSIQSLVHGFPQCGIDRCIISTDSGDVYEEDVTPIFEDNPKATFLLLLGVKLGLNAVNECYWQDIRDILDSKQSVGISGGRPSSSLYFFGFQHDYLFYLDPHSAQLNLGAFNSELDMYRSVHSTKFNKIHLSEMDPSMLIGILIQGKEDWEKWKLQMSKSKIIHVCDSRPLDILMNPDIESLYSMDEDEEEGQDMGRVSKQETLVDGEYVDLGSLVQQAESSRHVEDDDEYQDVKCKNQNIVIVGELNNSSTNVGASSDSVEVEKVLVEEETVPLREHENSIS